MAEAFRNRRSTKIALSLDERASTPRDTRFRKTPACAFRAFAEEDTASKFGVENSILFDRIQNQRRSAKTETTGEKPMDTTLEEGSVSLVRIAVVSLVVLPQTWDASRISILSSFT